MKRCYTDNVVYGPVDDGEEVHFVYRGSDIHAWALKHKQTVERMPHEDECEAFDFDSDDNECNCVRGDALREIEELIKE